MANPFTPILLLSPYLCIAMLTVGCGGNKKNSDTHCRPPGGCPQNSICAMGGCIPLIEDEPRVMWENELAILSGEDALAWQPRPAFGEKILSTDLCSGVEKNTLDKQKGGVLALQRSVTIYGFSNSDVRVLKQQKASSSMWQDHIKFRFPVPSITTPPAYCISQNINAIKVLPSKVENTVEATLVEAAPANTPFTVAIMERRALKTSPQSSLQYEFGLPPVRTSDRKDTSVLVLPLGTDVLAMEGLSPSKQRLLKNYVAYYFEHTDTRQRVSIKIKLPTGLIPPLNFSNMNL